MTSEQTYDYLERIVRSWIEEDFRTRRESRKQLEKLKALVEARKKNEEDGPAREKSDEETQT